jgi:Golgi to ER traffic protein 4
MLHLQTTLMHISMHYHHLQLQAKFLKAAIAWTAAQGTRQHGDAELNALLGRCLFSQHSYDAGMARLVIGEQPAELVEHLMRADLTSPEDAADVAQGDSPTAPTVAKKGSSNNKKQQQQPSAADQHRERLLTLGVLHFLGLGNLRDANVMREAWTAAAAAAAAAAGEGAQPVGAGSDGMQKFCRLLCRTCEHDAAPLFMKLVDTVSAGNGSDPVLEKLLAQVGRTFFGIQPPQGMLENMLKMLGVG